MPLLKFDPQRHELASIPFADHLQRRYPGENLFVYRHRLTEQYVIAKWTQPSARIMLELLVLGPSPAMATREMALEVGRRLRAPLTAEDIRRMAAPGERMQADVSDAENDRYKRVRSSKVQAGYGY